MKKELSRNKSIGSLKGIICKSIVDETEGSVCYNKVVCYIFIQQIGMLYIHHCFQINTIWNLTGGHLGFMQIRYIFHSKVLSSNEYTVVILRMMELSSKRHFAIFMCNTCYIHIHYSYVGAFWRPFWKYANNSFMLTNSNLSHSSCHVYISLPGK